MKLQSSLKNIQTGIGFLLNSFLMLFLSFSVIIKKVAAMIPKRIVNLFITKF